MADPLSMQEQRQLRRDWEQIWGDGGGVADLAAKWSHRMSARTVERYLARLGIQRGQRITSKVRQDPELGKVADSVLAERYSVSRARVQDIRSRLGIPAAEAQASADS